MNVMIIRHGKVDFQWRSRSTSEQFDRDCMAYDKAEITSFSARIPGNKSAKIYISSLPRSRDTAIQIFGKKNFTATKLLDEVPLRSSIVSKIKLPLLFWNLSGRLQWFFNHPRQPEGRKNTVSRAERFVEMLLQKKEDCFVITHGFFMHILIVCLKKKGFCINHKKLKYANGEYITARR